MDIPRAGLEASPIADSSETLTLLRLLIILLIVVEVLFYAWYVRELRHAQAIGSPPRLSLEDRNFVLNKMLQHAEDYGIWRQIQGWFLTRDGSSTHSPHEVGHEEFAELLAWAFFYKRVEDLDKDEIAWVELARKRIADDYQLDQTIRPGRLGVNCVRHTLDEIHAIHRPLIFYASIQIISMVHGLLLRLRGFSRGRHEGLKYWYRLKDCAGEQDASETIAFFHGLGMGVAMYLPFLVRLQSHNQMLFEMPWISMNPFAPIPSSTDYARWVVEAMRSHGVNSCVGVGHSFGSLPVAWLIRQYPAQLSRCVLIDPVAIFLNLPDVCVNFLYKQPKSIFGKVLRFFAAREFGIARALMRHFFWTDSVLFPEMLPSGSSVILMENDRIIPVKDIYIGVAKLPKIRTIVLPGLDHGNFLVWPSACSKVIEQINRVIRNVPNGTVA